MICNELRDEASSGHRQNTLYLQIYSIKNMTVTIETSGIQEVEQLLVLLKTFDIKNIKIQSSPSTPQASITRGDKNIDPKQLFGIWKDNPRTIEQIRSTNPALHMEHQDLREGRSHAAKGIVI